MVSKPSRFVHDVGFQFHRFVTWPFDLTETRRAMIFNDKQQITSKPGFSFFLFVLFAPLQQEFTSFMSACDSSADRMIGKTLSVPTSTHTPTMSPHAHRHKAFASVYLGGECRAQLLWPPSPHPRWSLLSPYSLGGRVVGLFGTEQPLCFLPGCPQEAGSVVILSVASRGGRTL